MIDPESLKNIEERIKNSSSGCNNVFRFKSSLNFYDSPRDIKL